MNVAIMASFWSSSVASLVRGLTPAIEASELPPSIYLHEPPTIAARRLCSGATWL